MEEEVVVVEVQQSMSPAVRQSWIAGLSGLVALLSAVATAVGIFSFHSGHHLTFPSLSGEAVSIQGGGLYAHESVSMAAQAVGQDIVTLVVGVPLLIVAIYLARRGSLRGRILRAGVLWYFAYTYLIMTYGAAYNVLFLVYVALFSAGLFAFILSLQGIDIGSLPTRFSPRFARRSIAWLMMVLGSFLLLLWFGRIVPALLSGKPPVGLDSSGTLAIQATDLAIAVPLAFGAGVLLLKRRAIGYLLSSVMVVMGTAMGLALVGMMIGMSLAGIPLAGAEVVGFTVLTLVFLAAAVHLFASIAEGPTPASWGGRRRRPIVERFSVNVGSPKHDPSSVPVDATPAAEPAYVDLYWIPLGAGGHSVRFNGTVFEAASAFLGRRPRRDLYHSALAAVLPDDRFVIEMTPVPDDCGRTRGVVGEGSVGARWAGRLRLFRYEIRRWRGGVIPDAAAAIASPVRVATGVGPTRRLLDLVPTVPMPVWGRDELAAGEMWNSNSVTSWLLDRAGVDTTGIRLPAGGRAPGWDAGLAIARRQGSDRPAVRP